jgi:hypothetical protein
MAVSSADASAAAWAEATIAAAEAYAQEQADAAAEQRDLAEQRAAAQGNDYVEPPAPSASERAQNAFWGNDPNRPASSTPSSPGGSGSSGPMERHPVSAEDAAALQQAGYTVVKEGDQYYFEAPSENVSVTQQAEPQAPSATHWIPDYGGTNTTSTSSTEDPPPAGPNNAPGGVNEARDAGAPTIDEDVKTGINAEVDGILSKSPTMARDWKDLQAKGWKIREGEAGKGTYADRDRKTIVVDPSEKGNVNRVSQLIAHEAGHAQHGLAPKVSDAGLTKEQFVQRNLQRHLDDEGAANFENAKVRDEIKQNGGPDIGIAGTQSARYEAIYEDYKAGRISEAEARTRMGNLFADGEHPSTDPGKTYREYYSKQYEDEWNTKHPPGSS